MSHKQPPLPNLTALRLFAALLVTLLHGKAEMWFSPGNPLRVVLGNGYTGVSIFFVLSGFVLAYNHVTIPSFRNFYILRLARVYPLHLFALLWMLPFALHADLHIMHAPYFFWGIPGSLLLVQTWFLPITFALNNPSWTLSVEAFFYLCFPLLIPWVVRHVHRLWVWVLLIWIVFLIPPVMLHMPFTTAKGQAWLEIICMLPIARLGEFLIGMFAGVAFRQRRPVFNTPTALATIAGAIVVFYFAAAYLPPQVVRNIAMAIPYAIMIYVLAGWPSRMLASPLLQFGGEISYGIYLLQFPVGRTLHVFYREPPFLLYLLVLCGVSSLTYLYLEKPARLWILHITGVRSSAKPLPTPQQVP